jgi:hypothetical protein
MASIKQMWEVIKDRRRIKEEGRRCHELDVEVGDDASFRWWTGLRKS